MHQCIGNKGTYSNRIYSIIFEMHFDDLIGIVPPEEDLDQPERSMEKTVGFDKGRKRSKMLGMELTPSKGQVILTQTGFIDLMASKCLETSGNSGTM